MVGPCQTPLGCQKLNTELCQHLTSRPALPQIASLPQNASLRPDIDLTGDQSASQETRCGQEEEEEDKSVASERREGVARSSLCQPLAFASEARRGGYIEYSRRLDLLEDRR